MNSSSLEIVFTGANQLEVRPLPAPQPPGPGEIAVAAHRSLISTGTECTCLSRRFAPGSSWDNWIRYPFHPGYSVAGHVTEIGKGVTRVKVGDRVAVGAHHASRVVIPADNGNFPVVPIPDGISDDEAAWFNVASVAQIGMRRAEHELGDDVVIIGLGLIGQMAVRHLRIWGARSIIAIDTAPKRLEMAKRGGATHLLNMDAAKARDAVAEITSGRLADVVYDMTGHPAVLTSALGLARRFGKLILLSDPGAPTDWHLTGDVLNRGVQIRGAHLGDPPLVAGDHLHWTRPNMGGLFLDFLLDGRMRVGDLITHRFAPSKAREAYDQLLNDRATAMGVIFEWDR